MKPSYRVKALSKPLLTVVPLAQPPTEDVLLVLRNFINLAERGEFRSIAVAAARYDGGISTAYHSGGGLFPLIAAVTAVDTRLRREIDS